MIAMSNSYENYKRQGVMMANPVELIVMLYDGCIKQLKLARLAINDNKFENSNKCMQKAQMIVVELINSLDFHYPIAKELLNIYDFMLRSFVNININKDVDLITRIIEMLSSLRDSWEQVLKMNRNSIKIMEE
jgi:flagellar protein FliS